MEERGRGAVWDFDLAIKNRGKYHPGNQDAIVDLLLTDLNCVTDLELDHDRPKPLSWAAQGGYDTVVEMLLNYMHDPSEVVLLQTAERGYIAIVRLLVQRGKVNLRFKSEKNETALWLAAHNGHEALVRLVLEADKVDVNAKDDHGDTPLFRALVHGHKVVASLLLKTGNINVNTKNSLGETPLTRLARMGREDMIRLLLETGKVEVDIKGNMGQTPLAHAACSGHEDVVRLLLDTGKVDINARDDSGHTPLSRVMQEQKAYKPSQEEIDRVESEFGYLWHPPNQGNGHEAIIALLREASKTKASNVVVNTEDILSRKTSRSRSVARKLKHIGRGM